MTKSTGLTTKCSDGAVLSSVVLIEKKAVLVTDCS